MERTLFRIAQMDCAAEENLVRMKLGEIAAVRALQFNLARREVVVIHDGDLPAVQQALEELGLGSRLLETAPTAELPHEEEAEQRRLLWAVLLINFAFFVIESVYGVLSGSMGLVADSLDMLADAIVYGLSLAAVGAAQHRKKSLATVSGYFQITLALLGLAEVIRRFLGYEPLPDFRIMIVVSMLALLANGASLYLLRRSGSREVHMQASMIFTSNDVIINLGVILAGVLVYWFNSGIPDLVVGGIVFVIVMRGAIRILRL